MTLTGDDVEGRNNLDASYNCRGILLPRRAILMSLVFCNEWRFCVKTFFHNVWTSRRSLLVFEPVAVYMT